jgi:hypothetical protein
MNLVREYISHNREEVEKTLKNQKFENVLKSQFFPLVKWWCPEPHSVEESPPVDQYAKVGNSQYLPGVTLAFYMNDMDEYCLNQKLYGKNLWPTNEK